ncbi:MAG: hypothetical protein ACC663_12340, partial [Gammaproteobacteria bacterium]
MRASVELIIPGLFHLPLHEFDPAFLQRDLPSLDYILRYANRVKTDVYELEPVLAECLGLPASQKLGLVHAYVEDPPSDGASHLLCQAVHLKPDMRNAIVLPLDDEGETRKDISIIIKDLNDMFKVDYYIKSVSDRLWVIHLKLYEAP